MIKLTKKIIILIVLVVIVLSILGMINFKRIKNQILMTTYKTEYSEYVKNYANEYGVDEYLIYAIIKAESNFNQQAVSNKEAKGLMQLMPQTAEDIAKKLDIEVTKEEISKKLLEPEFNINLGTKYISNLLAKYSNIELALTAYNAGSGNVDTWVENGTLMADGSNIENIPYKETNNYVRKILRDYEIYKKLYN